MTDLQRLIIGEGVQGGVLADYERRIRRYLPGARLGDQGAMGLNDLMRQMILHRAYWRDNDQEAIALVRILSRAQCAHLQLAS